MFTLLLAPAFAHSDFLPHTHGDLPLLALPVVLGAFWALLALRGTTSARQAAS